MEQYNNYNNNSQYMPQPKKKKGRLASVIAMVAAVAIIGGGAGMFGGAYISNSINNSIGIIGGEDGPTAVFTSDGNKEDGDVSAEGDIQNALNALNSSEKQETVKVHPSDVKPTGVNGEYTNTELYEAVNDTVVLIKVYTSEQDYNSYYYDYYFGYGRDEEDDEKDDEPVFSGYGSGVVFTDDGYILTNAHVVDGAEKITVVVNDYEDPDKTHEYDGEIIGSDNSTDIAIVKVDRKEKFVYAALGDSDRLKVGQDVCAIGNPGITGDIMFEHTMTKGIVSGLNRVSLSEGYSLSLIQTDTAINRGNSGGGLFDMYGNVVGVVNSKIVTQNYEGIGFALTINEAKPIMEDLLNYGYVKSRAVLGITTVELNEYRAELYGVRITKGLLVMEIREDAAAKKSDLRISDVITKIDGKNVETVSDVQSIIARMKAGDAIAATVARADSDGKMKSVEVEIELSESKQ